MGKTKSRMKCGHLAGSAPMSHSLLYPTLVNLSWEQKHFPEERDISVKPNAISPWCGIKRKVNEHKMMLGNTLQTKLRGRRVGIILEGEMMFSCVASLHDLHLWDKRDFQMTLQNGTVNAKYVNSLKFTDGWKDIQCYQTFMLTYHSVFFSQYLA